MTDMHSFFGEVISTYSRAQAIEDGVLVDVTAMAREAGFKIPVVLTAAAWAEAVAVGDKAQEFGQSEAGRLWDVLFVAGTAARVAAKMSDASQITCRVSVADGPGATREVVLVVHCGPGDNAEPVITIMLPNED